MEFLIGLVVGVVLGFAFRGAIAREVRVIGSDLRADFAKIVQEVKSKL